MGANGVWWCLHCMEEVPEADVDGSARHHCGTLLQYRFRHDNDVVIWRGYRDAKNALESAQATIEALEARLREAEGRVAPKLTADELATIMSRVDTAVGAGVDEGLAIQACASAINESLRSRLSSPSAPPADRVEECVWTPMDADSDGWETSCGTAFSLTTGTPAENQYKFCPHCGRALRSQGGPT